MASQAIVPRHPIVPLDTEPALMRRRAAARSSGGSLFQWVILMSVLVSAVWVFLGSVPE
jgi:hypothetical protein